MTILDTLNAQQKEAVISDAKRLLVLAGAGSGKTKTLLQKIIYLIETKGIQSNDILAVTFTKNAANEMIDRLILSADKDGTYQHVLYDKKKSPQEKAAARRSYVQKYKWIENLTVRTFHSFGYKLLRDLGVQEFDNQFKIVCDEKVGEEDEYARFIATETVYDVVHKLLIGLCENTDYLLALKRYLLDYVVDKIHLREQAGYHHSYTAGKYYTSLDGTRVRSKSEQFIADYLFRNNISYQYEPQIQVKDFAFHPDFYIPDANLYIEHVSEKSYPMQGKEKQYREGNILYAKTYEKTAQDSALFTHTLDNLVRGRLTKSYSKNVVISYQEAFKGHLDHIREFIRTIVRITDMMKVECFSPEQALHIARQDPHERIRNFYALAIPLINAYAEYCVNKSYLDFNDLISWAVALLENQADVAHKVRNRYRFILVDEFQDVNNLQVDLLKLLLTNETQLFCVGDDWQSIYGFRGSEVGYIVEFEKHFPGAEIIKLNLNYRSTQHIVSAGNEVIKNNKFQIEKEILAAKMSEQKIAVFAGQTEAENVAYCVRQVQANIQEGVPPEEIMMLYRRSKMVAAYYEALRKAGLYISFKTIHAAKGLEAKVVFIVGLTEGPGGFPDIWLEDRIFQVVKRANLDLLLEEERRLFYVALTRARDMLYLITLKGQESSFLREIPGEYTVRTAAPLAAVVPEGNRCVACSRMLEGRFVYCPYCGRKA